MSINYSARSGGIIETSMSLFNFLLHEGILCVLIKNRLIEAILMSTHTIFNIKKENHPILSQICALGYFQGTQERNRSSRRKRAISFRATDGLLYMPIIFNKSFADFRTCDIMESFGDQQETSWFHRHR